MSEGAYFAFIVLSFVVFAIVSPHGSAYSASPAGAFAASSLGATVLAPVFLAGLILGQKSTEPATYPTYVKLWVRALAFFIDFATAMLVIAPTLAFSNLMVEAFRTGAFHWSFARAEFRPTDAIGGVFILAALAALLFYFREFPRHGKPTPGQFVMGYQIISGPEQERRPQFALRAFLAYAAICWWPIWFISFRGVPAPQGRLYFWERWTNTRAVRF
jgi:RDD family